MIIGPKPMRVLELAMDIQYYRTKSSRAKVKAISFGHGEEVYSPTDGLVEMLIKPTNLFVAICYNFWTITKPITFY